RPLEHQLNFFHEMGLDPELCQRKLREATVSVVGMGPAGVTVAMSLAAAGIGNLRIADPDVVLASDPLLNPQFRHGDVGKPRAEVVRAEASALASSVNIQAHTSALDSDDALAQIVAGSDFVIGCVDQSRSNVMYRLNRACLQAGIRWCAGSVSGFEGIVGPTVTPFESACYLCYRMRAV